MLFQAPETRNELTLDGADSPTIPGVTTLLLKSFQPLHRVDRLRSEGVLVGDWDRVGGPVIVPRYRRMVEEMAARGIDCAGHPPVWAWHGRVTLLDAFMLLDVEHELSQGWATITFTAPANLVHLSDYAAWCDFFIGGTQWDPTASRSPAEQASDDWAGWTCGVQATLPYLRREWVDAVEPLPRDGWDGLDLNTLV